MALAGFATLDLRRDVLPTINWRDRVKDHLDALAADGWTAHDDWWLMENLFIGVRADKVQMPHGNRTGSNAARALALMGAARDLRGVLNLDGRIALIEALRARVK